MTSHQSSALTVAVAGRQMSSKTSKFDSLLEALPDALLGVDHAGVIRFVNHQTELLFGYDREDLIGAPLEILVPESLRPVHKVHRKAYVAAPSVRAMGQDLELRGRRQDGTQFPLDIALSHADTEDGPLAIAAVRDITGRKETEEARQQSERLAAIVEHSNDAIVAETLDGIVTSWNPAAERMYGYSSEEMVGTSIDRLSPEGRTADILAKVRAGQVVEHFETERVRRDGTVFPASLTVSPIRDVDGVVVGASTIARDVTDLVQARETAQGLSKALRTSNDSLRDFVAVASHDLRAPLVTIGGFATILTDNWAKLSDEDRLKQLGAIQRGVNRLSRLTDDLLTSAKVEAEAEQSRPERIRLAAALASYLEADREELGDVAVTCPPELVAVVDPSHLTRILDNYLGNAFKYGDPPICIEADRVGDFVELRVRDHGPGVPPEFVSRLFTKFGRADTPTTRATQGTGLGLSIVKALAEANHGDARYQPDDPNGGCFVARLPAAAA